VIIIQDGNQEKGQSNVNIKGIKQLDKACVQITLLAVSFTF